MPKRNIQITTNQGPSAENQTSEDHSHDPNQRARQPNVRDVVEADGVADEIESDVVNRGTDTETTNASESTEDIA